MTLEAWRTVDGPVHLERVEIPSTPIAKLPESSGLDSKLFAREASSKYARPPHWLHSTDWVLASQC